MADIGSTRPYVRPFARSFRAGAKRIVCTARKLVKVALPPLRSWCADEKLGHLSNRLGARIKFHGEHRTQPNRQAKPRQHC